jgi:hypothetical protein
VLDNPFVETILIDDAYLRQYVFAPNIIIND